MWYIYVIENNSRTYRYVGMTEDIDERLKDHNFGKTKSTKPYRPFNKIVILGRAESAKRARVLEKYYKSGQGR